MKKKEPGRRNPVAKHCEKFNRPATHKIKKGKGAYRRIDKSWKDNICILWYKQSVETLSF